MTMGGSCDARFARVREVFAAGFADGCELGAAVAVEVGGRRVVDLWGGWADKARTRPFAPDSLVNVFSATKGIATVTALLLADAGRLDIEAPAATLWPELAAAGKERITVADVLSHRAGLPALRAQRPPDALYDAARVCAALAAEAPWWAPGSAHGYHAMTFGWLVGELVRRADGRSLGTVWRQELAAPLGIDFHIGVAPPDDARLVDVRHGPPPGPGERNLFAEIQAAPDSMTARAFANPAVVLDTAVANSVAFRRAELPAVNGHGNARALARLYGALAHGGELEGKRILSPSILAAAVAERSYGHDLVLGETTRFGLGFMLANDGLQLGPSARAFGHPGAGGAIGFADPDAGVGFGYVPNRLGNKVIFDPRAAALVDALYGALG